jgi:phospholipase C
MKNKPPVANPGSTNLSPMDRIKHVVVLMFENRSFDHLFGGLLNPNGGPLVNGVLGPDGKVNTNWETTSIYNTADPTIEPSQATPPIYPTPINLETQPVAKPGRPGKAAQDFNPNHNFDNGMMPDLFGPGTTGYVAGQAMGAPPETYPQMNSGFLYVNDPEGNDPGVMTYFEDGSLQVLHALAKNFVVCDNWFCDMPGHTMPNRDFMHCATTALLGIDDSDWGLDTASTIFEQIDQYGQDYTRDWKIYRAPCTGSDASFLNKYIRTNSKAHVDIAQFAEDIGHGTLPFYSFLMCWTFHTKDTSLHPPALVQPGENYLAAVYNTLVNSKLWQDTLLIVTFDENGGIYDHVPPPRTVQPVAGPPASENNGVNQFDFTLLGPRIPVVLISPWLKAGVDSTQYQNTSILRFIEDKLVPPPSPPISLTNRDAYATSIANAFDQFGLEEPRTNATYPQYLAGHADKDYVPPWLEIVIMNGAPCPLFRTHYWAICEPNPDDVEAARPPLAYQVEVAKEYAARQPGHADSGKPIKREFPTIAALTRYMQQRDQAARWHDEGLHLKSSLRVVETKPGQWIWELNDSDGMLLAAAPKHCDSRASALRNLDLVRFLLYELSTTP